MSSGWQSQPALTRPVGKILLDGGAVDAGEQAQVLAPGPAPEIEREVRRRFQRLGQRLATGIERVDVHVGDAGQGRQHAVIPARDVREPEDVQGLARERRGRSPHGLVPQRLEGQPPDAFLVPVALQPPARTEEGEPQGALPRLERRGDLSAVPPARQHLGARARVLVEERRELRGELGAAAVDRVRLRARGQEVAAHPGQLASAEEALVV